jgi:hypothetical protein
MFQMKRILLVIALVATAMGSAFAQIKLGDNPGNLNQNALLELESSSKGLLLPRMNTTQQNSMSAPPDGMMLYNTDSACICVRGAGFWHSLCSEGNGKPWGTLGNSNTDPVNNFVGTKDNQSLVFRTNNAEVMRILTNGNIGVGTTTPTNKLHIVASADPLRIEGLQTSAITDSIVTVDAVTGVLRRTTMSIIGANSVTVGNGLTKVGSLITFGGTLTAPTTTLATSAINTLNITGLQTSATTDSIVTIDAATGLLRRTTMAIIGANSFTTDNGLTKTGSNVRLGGNLLVPTTLGTSATNTLNVTGLQTSAVTDSIVTIDAATGQLRRTTMAIVGANSIVVGNGLTKVGNLITFGGALTSPTAINTSATNTLTLGNLQTGTLNPSTDSILITGAGGVVSRVNINALSAASPDFWLDGAGLKPDGTTDNTDRVYRMGLVGIGLTTTPTSTFQVEGSVSKSIVTTSAATFAVTNAHHTIIADCTALAGVTLNLPVASTCTGRIYYISKSDETTNLLSFNIPLKLTETTNVSSYNYTKRLTIQSDGASWRVISE